MRTFSLLLLLLPLTFAGTTVAPNATSLAPTATPPTSNVVPSDSTNTAIAITLGILGGITLIVIIIGCCYCANSRAEIAPADYSSFQGEEDDIESFMSVGMPTQRRVVGYDKEK
jgi:hypothetical protein